jgi:hypothetical protein
LELAPVSGFGEGTVRVLRSVVVDDDSQGDQGHLWSCVELGDRWFELDGTCLEEVSFENMVASRVFKGVVGLF